MASAAPTELRLAVDAPSRAYIDETTVQARAERVAAIVPAEVTFDEDHTVRVTSPVAGRITSLDAAPGQRVAIGGALAHILSSDVAQAGSDLAKADATLAQATAALARTRDLYTHEIAALREVQQAENDAAQARAERARAAARVRQLGSSQGADFVLRSPIAGTVVDRAANPGAEVHGDGAQPLFVVSALDHVWLSGRLSPRDAAAVRPGARLTFNSDALPGHPIEARVAWLGDVVDPATRTIPVRAIVSNVDHALRAQLFGQMRIYVADSSAVASVPSVALVTRGSGTVVYVETTPGHIVRRGVHVGDDDGTTAVVTSGLAVGEHVVTRGSLLLDAMADEAGVATVTTAPATPGPATVATIEGHR